MKGTGQEVCGQFPNIMLIYGHEAENILVFMSVRTGHTSLSVLRILVVLLKRFPVPALLRYLCVLKAM